MGILSALRGWVSHRFLPVRRVEGRGSYPGDIAILRPVRPVVFFRAEIDPETPTARPVKSGAGRGRGNQERTRHLAAGAREPASCSR